MFDENEIMRAAVIAAGDVLTGSLQEPVEMKMALSLIKTGRITTAELVPFLGSNWVVARRTKRIVETYGDDVNCISSNRLDEAYREALHARIS